MKLTKKEYEKRKRELAEKIKTCTEAEIAEVKAEMEELRNAEISEVDERSLLAESIEGLEARSIVPSKKEERKEQKMEENILENQEYRSAFIKKLQGKKLNENEERAMTTATNSVGAAIPATTLNRIDEKMQETSGLYDLIDVLVIPGHLAIPIEDVTNDANWVTEGKTSTDSDDTLKKVNFGAYTLIKTISITAEVQNMAIEHFENWIVNKLAAKMAVAIEKAILKGTGEGQPTGILTEEITKIQSAVSGKIGYADICGLEAKLKSGYKRNAVYVMNTNTLWKDIATILVGDKPIFIPDAVNGFAGKILGKPVIESEFADEGKVLLADMGKYTMNWSAGIGIKSNDSTEFRSGSRVYRGMALVDGKVVNKEAFVLLEKSTASVEEV